MTESGSTIIARCRRRIALWIWLALLSALFSFTPFAENTGFMVLPISSVTEAQDAFPHQLLGQWVVGLWQNILQGLSQGGLLTQQTAQALTEEGFALSAVWQVIAIVFLLFAAGQLRGLSKALRVQEMEIEAQLLREETIKNQLQQARVALGNILLDPNAQAFSEDITKASRQIQESINGL